MGEYDQYKVAPMSAREAWQARAHFLVAMSKPRFWWYLTKALLSGK
jgi:hypothetical protein